MVTLVLRSVAIVGANCDLRMWRGVLSDLGFGVVCGLSNRLEGMRAL